MTYADPGSISAAVAVWTGRDQFDWPRRDDARVVAEFGEERAAELLPALHALEEEFYESDACHRIADLSEMGKAAAAEFRDRHPELPADVSEALAWCYTFDHK